METLQHHPTKRRNNLRNTALLGLALTATGFGVKVAGDKYAPLSVRMEINHALFSANEEHPNTIPVFLNDDVDPLINDEIDTYMSRLPTRLVNAIGNDGYKVKVVKTIEEVQALYTGSKNVAGFTSQIEREIVIYNPANFPHEVGHAVDFAYGRYALSDKFLDASRNYFTLDLEIADEIDTFFQNAQKPTTEEMQNHYAELHRESAAIRKAYKIISLTGGQRINAIASNPDLEDTIQHLFVYAFLAHYFPELDEKAFKSQYPELLTVLQDFDKQVQDLR